MYEMVALKLLFVIWVPVSTYRKDRFGLFIYGNDVGERNFELVFFLITVFVVFDDDIDVHFKQFIPVVGLCAEAELF